VTGHRDNAACACVTSTAHIWYPCLYLLSAGAADGGGAGSQEDSMQRQPPANTTMEDTDMEHGSRVDDDSGEGLVFGWGFRVMTDKRGWTRGRCMCMSGWWQRSRARVLVI
jgi:hypothetical protein